MRGCVWDAVVSVRENGGGEEVENWRLEGGGLSDSSRWWLGWRVIMNGVGWCVGIWRLFFPGLASSSSVQW